MKQVKEIKDIPLGKEEINCPVFKCHDHACRKLWRIHKKATRIKTNLAGSQDFQPKYKNQAGN
jgi:hypothetical protein